MSQEPAGVVFKCLERGAESCDLEGNTGRDETYTLFPDPVAIDLDRWPVRPSTALNSKIPPSATRTSMN
jgi:hypothetical protein